MKDYTVTVYYDDETGGEFDVLAVDEEAAEAYVINHLRMTGVSWVDIRVEENAE